MCMGFTKGTQLNCHVVKLNLFYTSSYAHAHTLDLVWNGFDAFTLYIYIGLLAKKQKPHIYVRQAMPKWKYKQFIIQAYDKMLNLNFLGTMMT